MVDLRKLSTWPVNIKSYFEYIFVTSLIYSVINAIHTLIGDCKMNHFFLTGLVIVWLQ